MNTNPCKIAAAAAAASLLLAAVGAQAASVSLAGDIAHHNDVVHLDFSLAAAADVRVWTDSWLLGLNFDPTAALWAPAGNDYQLVLAVDDDDAVAPGQGFYDTGFVLPALAAGSYRITLAAAINNPLGLLLSQGFAYDSEAPIALAFWNQPSYDPNLNDQKGTAWRVNFSGVDAAVVAVSEPTSMLLAALALGLVALSSSSRRTGREGRQEDDAPAFESAPRLPARVWDQAQRAG